jgi:enamine deaminase RidA (YjgF/YER057c/UK114 family)
MAIKRIGITDGAAGMPIMSRAVVRGKMVYLCGVVPDPVGDITTQTRQVLDKIDELLASAGTDKSRLLTAQLWLSDMAHFGAMNAVWNAWVDPVKPPVRACVEAALFRPEVLVEIMVTAAKPGSKPGAKRQQDL